MTPHEIDDTMAHRSGHAIRLLASALLFATDVANTLKAETEPAPTGLCQRVQHLADTCASLSKDEPARIESIREDQIAIDPITPPWRAAAEHLDLVEVALTAFCETLPSPTRATRVGK